MESSGLIILLAVGTLGVVIGFALLSKWRTEQKLQDDDAPKSSLASDK
ncbi:hypothetical protein [Pseudaestuariivita rosea]|nr:hypothetical protein [Pseudaestuariivita rosea]